MVKIWGWKVYVMCDLGARSLEGKVTEAADNAVSNLKSQSFQCAHRWQQQLWLPWAADLHPCLLVLPLHVELKFSTSENEKEILDELGISFLNNFCIVHWFSSSLFDAKIILNFITATCEIFENRCGPPHRHAQYRGNFIVLVLII